ncbi:hypothetical protein Tco_0117817, partial [Tanacetum coccineum]
IDAIPNATKPPSIVDWKIIPQFGLKAVIKKYGVNRPKEIYDRVLWGDLKTMFDPPLSGDVIWSLPLQQKMINWRYYSSCVVHCLTLDDTTTYMLADRKYPLSKDACQVMLKMKLLDGITDEVSGSCNGVEKDCTDISKLIRKQLKKGQARTRESEEYKKKPKNQSRSQKVKDRSQIQSTWSTAVNHYKTKPHNNPIPVLQLSQKAKNDPSSLNGP